VAEDIIDQLVTCRKRRDGMLLINIEERIMNLSPVEIS